jgi:hypothetical protein
MLRIKRYQKLAIVNTILIQIIHLFFFSRAQLFNNIKILGQLSDYLFVLKK